MKVKNGNLSFSLILNDIPNFRTLQGEKVFSYVDIPKKGTDGRTQKGRVNNPGNEGRGRLKKGFKSKNIRVGVEKEKGRKKIRREEG